MFSKKGVLRNFTKFTAKHMCQPDSLFSIKFQASGQSLRRRCFPVNFLKISKDTFITEHLWATASILHLLHVLNSWLIIEMKSAQALLLYYFSIAVGITLVDVHLTCLSWFHFLILEEILLIILIDGFIFTKIFMSTVSFLA